MKVESSIGDVMDRITILEIKRDRGLPVIGELDALATAWRAAGLPPLAEIAEYGALVEVNRALWDVEDRLRAREAGGDFGAEFVADARSVYRVNDRRAALKRAVNERFGSALREEKLHPAY